MKIGESFEVQDGKLLHIEKHDPNPYLDQATYLRHKREATGKFLISWARRLANLNMLTRLF
jgi:hypothetical protein